MVDFHRSSQVWTILAVDLPRAVQMDDLAVRVLENGQKCYICVFIQQ
jgi:hypothetical protein